MKTPMRIVDRSRHPRLVAPRVAPRVSPRVSPGISPLIARLMGALVLSLAAFGAPAAAQVELNVERFGVGSTYRPGDPTAIRVAATWRGSEARPVQIVWEVENADGDITEQTRTVVLNPGQTVSRWLYGRPGPRTEPQTTFTLRAFAEDEGRRGAELGVTRFSPSTASVAGTPVALEQRLVTVLGDGRMGLEGYGVALPTLPMAVASHEMTRVATGLDAREMPDRWEGLSSIEAIVWSTAPPQQLGLDEADALREWIRRGGQLVIVLPQAGNPWALGAPPSHPLHDLLPSRAPRRVEGVPFQRIVDLLSKDPLILNPRAATTLTIFDPTQLDRGWDPLLAIPAERTERTGRLIAGDDGLGGAVVGIQRDFGFGQITLLGIDADAANRLRLQAGHFPQADAFWNRVLGRRCDTPQSADIVALERVRPPLINLSTTGVDSLGGGALAATRIAMSGEAVVGTLAALTLFVVYWLLAGPGGFGLLRARRLSHHAWLAFVATAAIFTAIAWMGGAALRQGNVRMQHVTFIDHISMAGRGAQSDEPQYQRASTWFSAYLPGYGPTRISVDSQPGVRNLLTSWMTPPAGTPQRFPNTDRYAIPLGSPADYPVPARATAVQMEATWLGNVDPSWGSMPIAIEGHPVREHVTERPEQLVSVSGQLRHALPATLRQVVILHVSSIRTPLRREMPATDGRPAPIPNAPGELLNFGRIVVRDSWEAGEILDLGRELYPDGARNLVRDGRGRDGLAAAIDGRYASEFAVRGGLAVDLTPSPARARLYMEALSLFSLMKPPSWTREQSIGLGERTEQRLLRNFGRDLDLGPWFGRPCIVILGFLESTPSPVPIRIDGIEPPSDGLTVVRWICPLPVDADLIIATPRHRSDPSPTDAP